MPRRHFTTWSQISELACAPFPDDDAAELATRQAFEAQEIAAYTNEEDREEAFEPYSEVMGAAAVEAVELQEVAVTAVRQLDEEVLALHQPIHPTAEQH